MAAGDQHSADPDELIEVQLRGVPLALHSRAREHSEELQREFALIHHGRSEVRSNVPARLLQLVEQLRGRFGGFAQPVYEEMAAARARGEDRLDVVFVVPRGAAPAAVELTRMLDEADAFCRSGDLLTLATPEELVAFRRWFLEEFVRQSEGRPPRSWDAFRSAPPAAAAQ